MFSAKTNLPVMLYISILASKRAPSSIFNVFPEAIGFGNNFIRSLNNVLSAVESVSLAKTPSTYSQVLRPKLTVKF